MSLIRFSDKFMEKSPVESFKFVESGIVENFVTYITSSDFRKAVSLRPWIRKQVGFAESGGFSGILAKCDDTVVQLLKQVIRDVEYVPDQDVWRMPEYWQTAEETLKLNTGDCEDGAVLLYVLCRNAGVPAERLLLFAGDVQNPYDKKKLVGHCVLLYRPDNYPLNFAVLDWCYWPDKKVISERMLYTFDGQLVWGYKQTEPNMVADRRYVRAWFLFNENKSTISLTI